MHFNRLTLMMVALLTTILSTWAESETVKLNKLELSQVEGRLLSIDGELEQLARASLRTGVGTVAFRTENHLDPHHTEWIQVDLSEEILIDQITLVPAIWRDSQTGYQADGFPVTFKLISGTKSESKGTVLASFSAEDNLLPRVTPVTINFPPTKASWVRLEATELSSRAWDNHYILQLSEILIFSDSDNVALHQTVSVSSHGRGESIARRQEVMVDGQLPYLMDAAQGEKSIAFMENITGFPNPELTIDLRQTQPLNRIHLHTMELTDNVPQSNEPATGTPLQIRIEGAQKPDFSDAVLLSKFQRNSIFEAGPILMMRFPETDCRYVRIQVLEPFKGQQYTWLGFAEIELFAKGQNVALGKPVSTNFTINNKERRLSALTDGRNLYGNILPIREWVEQLAYRHQLETERPLVENELARRYAQQKANLRRIRWLAAFLFFISVIAVLIEKLKHQRSLSLTRERIAANLHDELGANLHAIGLLGDYAKKIIARKNAQDEWNELSNVIDEVRELTELTGETARYCTNMLETKEIHAHLIEEMKHTADRLLTDLSYEVDFAIDEASLQILKPRRRIDLYLFYKECLTNVIRHSNATDVSTRLTSANKYITLTISDNGQGLREDIIPKSLRRRARLLGGKVHVENKETGGLRITLQIHARRRRLWQRN